MYIIQEVVNITKIKENHLTNGKILPSLLMFSLPMIFTSILQQFYNIVDCFIAGKYIHSDALSAISVSTAVIFLYLALSIGLSMGCGVIIAQYYGAKQYAKMKTTIYTGFLATIAVAILITIVGMLFINNMLELLNTKTEFYKDAKDYLAIYQYSLILVFIYNTACSAFNALGDSKMPLIFLFISVILNIFLDIYFVNTQKMGVAGIAWATLICQAIACALSLITLWIKLRKIKPEAKTKIFHFKTFKLIVSIGVPSIIQQSIVSIGFLFIQRVVNGYPIEIANGYNTALKIDGIAIAPLINLGNAVSTFVAQNAGAKKPERIVGGYRAGLLLDFIISLVIGLCIWFFCNPLVGAFINKNEVNSAEIIAYGTSYLKVVSLFYFLLGVMNTTNSVFRGVGKMGMFMLITLANFVVRLCFVYGLTGFISYHSVWWSLPVSWVVSCVVSLSYYKFGKWRERSLISSIPENHSV